MVSPDAVGLLAGAVVLGVIHGMEPGHGWPVAASYALDRAHYVLYGFLASLVIGVGHLVSSLAMVAAFFYAKSYFDLEAIDDQITILGGVQIGGPVSLVAGVLLIALGVREAMYGHSHSHEIGDDAHGEGRHHHESENSARHHDDGDHDHHHGHSRSGGGFRARLRGLLPGSGGRRHVRHGTDTTADRGLFGIAWFAFLLGFAHEEEFEIIALCAGSTYCLELMVAYALTVICSIVGLTMLLIAGYRHAEERVERFTPYLPAFSAAVLVTMGLGFVAGVF